MCTSVFTQLKLYFHARCSCLNFFFMVEESSQPTKHANKILVSIFLSMRATILDTHSNTFLSIQIILSISKSQVIPLEINKCHSWSLSAFVMQINLIYKNAVCKKVDCFCVRGLFLIFRSLLPFFWAKSIFYITFLRQILVLCEPEKGS